MFTIVALSLCYQPHLRPTITTPRASTPMLSEQWSVDAIGKAIGNMAFEKTTDAMAFVVEKIDTALSEEPIIDATKSEPIRRPKAAQITPPKWTQPPAEMTPKKTAAAGRDNGSAVKALASGLKQPPVLKPRPQPAQPQQPPVVRPVIDATHSPPRLKPRPQPTQPQPTQPQPQPPAATNAGIVDATKKSQPIRRAKAAQVPQPTPPPQPQPVQQTPPQRAPAPAPQSDASSLDCGPKIKVVGIGGGGCSTVSRIPYALGGHLGSSVDLLMLNTDAQALEYTRTTHLAPLSPPPSPPRSHLVSFVCAALLQVRERDGARRCGRLHRQICESVGGGGDGGGSGGLLQGQHRRGAPADDVPAARRGVPVRPGCRRPTELGRLRCGRSRGGDQSQA